MIRPGHATGRESNRSGEVKLRSAEGPGENAGTICPGGADVNIDLDARAYRLRQRIRRPRLHSNSGSWRRLTSAGTVTRTISPGKSYNMTASYVRAFGPRRRTAVASEPPDAVSGTSPVREREHRRVEKSAAASSDRAEVPCRGHAHCGQEWDFCSRGRRVEPPSHARLVDALGRVARLRVRATPLSIICKGSPQRVLCKSAAASPRRCRMPHHHYYECQNPIR